MILSTDFEQIMKKHGGYKLNKRIKTKQKKKHDSLPLSQKVSIYLFKCKKTKTNQKQCFLKHKRNIEEYCISINEKVGVSHVYFVFQSP